MRNSSSDLKVSFKKLQICGSFSLPFNVRCGSRASCLLLPVVILLFFAILSMPRNALAFKLPDTGETTCYGSSGNVISCVGTGQDGAYNINPMSFTDNGDGTVTDNNTGLMWQKCSVGQNNDSTCSGTLSVIYWYKASGTYNWEYNPTSQNVCGSLNLGGYSDWRLPSQKELMTIVDYEIPYPGPTINTTYFPNTPSTAGSSNYWSSTTYANFSGTMAWLMDFNNGEFGWE